MFDVIIAGCVEKDPEPVSSLTRVVSLHVRSLELMAMRGLLDRLLAHGRQRPVGGIFAAIPKPAPENPSRTDTLMGELKAAASPEEIATKVAEVRETNKQFWLRPFGEGVHSVVVPAAQIHGHAPETLLDTYHNERHPVAEDVLNNTRAQVELASTDPGPQAVRRLLTELMNIDKVNQHLIEKITAISIRYDFGPGPDQVGRRQPDIVLKQGPLYGHLRQGRGLVLDRTERLTSDGWQDRVDLITDPTAALDDVPALVLRPDGYIAWIGEHQQALNDHLTRWFGKLTS